MLMMSDVLDGDLTLGTHRSSCSTILCSKSVPQQSAGRPALVTCDQVSDMTCPAMPLAYTTR